ncbi:MAG: hypothetical protein ACUVQ8_02435 [Nitrososphaeria archaeon]
MNKNIAPISFMVAWAAVTILALTWGALVIWPDNVHTDYGFPFDWGIHTINTIAGPVDRWNVDITALAIDLVFWLGLMILVTALMLYTSKR